MLASIASYALIAAAALQPVLAGVYITSPVAGTSATGGQVLEVKWADDGQTPTVASVGPCSVDIYTGSTNNQVKLQNLAASVDVSKTSSISATIDPSIGQDDSHYFVRFTSLSLKSPSNPQYPYQAFSAMFPIGSMTGSFNASVLAAIDAGDGSSSVSAAATKTAGSGLAASASGSSSGSSSKSASSSSSTGGASSGAMNIAEIAPAGALLAAAGIVSYIVL
ncbi:hypothetical protein I317_00110 [Kwoniella heveanensis CBS 569]|uniref:Yeast cell wall synthesis Kre9/Knh1-like N-terminal domain-containing protein n=1 Tax=Kwoniella heveanensis BCC8398 TaxID=1296120 RepID=A0A1B9H1L2_9TREE|nr:hypothetical protein I316_01073 [Kwoniella heveanensis BCC8398]OCF46022.1 hypothetical protein I317_00110 [Kwoniella heveanensis CBS 569]